MKLTDRFGVVWRNRKRFHAVPEVSAGRVAELRVAALLEERFRHTAYDYFAGLRVPTGRRRHEIDFVITTPEEIWVVELKNWSGFAGVDGSRVIQHRSHGRGVVDHGNLLSNLRHKERSLRKYLRRSVDEVPPTWSILVFANENLAIADELAGVDDMGVVRLPEFMSALPAPLADYGPIWDGLRRIFGSVEDEEKERFPVVSEPIRQVREALAGLGTWDLMAMHGGQILSGDVVGFSSDELYDRDRFKRLRVEVPRSLFDVFRTNLDLRVTAVERSGAHRDYELDLDEEVIFHAAGQKKASTFSLRDVEAISFG